MPERWVNVKQNSESTWPRIYDFSEAYNPPTCSKKVVTNRKSLIKLFDTCPVLPTGNLSKSNTVMDLLIFFHLGTNWVTEMYTMKSLNYQFKTGKAEEDNMKKITLYFNQASPDPDHIMG